MDNSQHAQPHRYELTHTPDTHVHPVYPVLYSFSKHIPFLFLKHSHVLKALTHFEANIQAKQGSIMAIKVAILPGFAVKQYAVYKTGIGYIYKTRTEACIKGGG
jgi:hypothetical protein